MGREERRMNSEQCGKEVRYSKAKFIKSFAVNERKIAENYCENNPKDDYGSEDYRDMYYLIPHIEHHQVVGSGRWCETDTDRDRLINDYNRSLYGE